MGTTISGFPRAIGFAAIPGGAAGAHAVPGGIGAGDALISVRHVSADLVTNADRTAEFSIPAGTAGTIDNALGTNTTGGFLLVTWAEGE